MHPILNVNLPNVAHWAIATLTGISKVMQLCTFWGYIVQHWSSLSFNQSIHWSNIARGKSSSHPKPLWQSSCSNWLGVWEKKWSQVDQILSLQQKVRLFKYVASGWDGRWKGNESTYHCNPSAISMGRLSLSRSNVLIFFFPLILGYEARTAWLKHTFVGRSFTRWMASDSLATGFTQST